jgi:hypothetical protein
MKNEKSIQLGLQDMEMKYERLVWFARKPPEDDPWWDTIRPDIKTAAHEAMADMERDYPKEVASLKGESGDWEHGFNSGMLAAIRWVWSASGEGVSHANAMFPELDT